MSLHSQITEFKTQEDERMLSESDLILEDDEDIDESMIITNGRISIIWLLLTGVYLLYDITNERIWPLY